MMKIKFFSVNFNSIYYIFNTYYTLNEKRKKIETTKNNKKQQKTTNHPIRKNKNNKNI